MPENVYELVGGQSFFDRLVDAFYAVVATDALLRPMYPEDLTDSKRHLALFLAQYWGGPPIYMAERGHPRLRMRHVPFPITADAHDAWLVAMTSALATVGGELSEAHLVEMNEYFIMAARQMRNN